MPLLTRLLLPLALALAFSGAAHAAEADKAAPLELPPAIPAGSFVPSLPPVAPPPAGLAPLAVPSGADLPPAPEALPPALPPPPLPPSAQPEKAVKPGIGRSAIRSSKPQTPRSFLTRSQLESQRSHCGIAEKGPTTLHAPAAGGEFTVVYEIKGGRNCLTGAGSDTTWANVLRADEGKAVVEVEPNTTGSSRESTVAVIARNGKSVPFVITQPSAGSSSKAKVSP